MSGSQAFDAPDRPSALAASSAPGSSAPRRIPRTLASFSGGSLGASFLTSAGVPFVPFLGLALLAPCAAPEETSTTTVANAANLTRIASYLYRTGEVNCLSDNLCSDARRLVALTRPGPPVDA